MIVGAFDDRNDVRLMVKLWLQQHDPDVYAPERIRLIVADSIKNDRDPVDSLADSWREASYGAILGIVEFASEELKDLAKTERSNASLQSASLRTGAALSCLPYDPIQIHDHLEQATSDLRDAHGQQEVSSGTQALTAPQAARALQALALAKAMLRN